MKRLALTKGFKESLEEWESESPKDRKTGSRKEGIFF